MLALYPEAFRRRYAAEMRRDFCELSREGLKEGGRTELVRVWAAMLSDLLVTALKERSTVPVRNGHLSVEPRVTARAVVAIVLIAVTVAVASMVKTPQYEASIMILVGHKLEFEETRKNVLGLEQLTQTMAEAVGSRVVAEAVIQEEGLSARPEGFLEQGLSVERVPETQFIEVVYTDTDPQRAQRVANTVGEVFSGKVSEVSRGANPITATLGGGHRSPRRL